MTDTATKERTGATGASVWERYAAYLRDPPEITLEWNDPESSARGWLVINSLKGGAAGGGTRMRAGLGREEVIYLAKLMELKFAFSGPGIGGAKSGIDYSPGAFDKTEVLGRWFRAARGELAIRYGTAGDLNVDEAREVLPGCRAIGLGHPQQGVLRGHLGLSGESLDRRLKAMRAGLEQVVGGERGMSGEELGVSGVELRMTDLITGYGVAAATLHSLERQGRDPHEIRALVEGFGCVGGAAALYLARAGVRIMGIADVHGELVPGGGLGAEEIEDLLRRRKGNRLPAPPADSAIPMARVAVPTWDAPSSTTRGPESPGAGDGSSGADTAGRFWRTPADLFVAAAASETVDDAALGRLDELGVHTIACGANRPFRCEFPGDTRLERSADERFAVVPDIVANCGAAHAFARQIRSDEPIAGDEIFASVRRTITEALDEVAARTDGASGTGHGLLAGAVDVAMERRGAAASGRRSRHEAVTS